MAKTRSLILNLIFSSLVFAQTARYPAAVATNADLTDLADRAQTTLSGSLNSSATSFTVVSGSKFAANMILTIDNEQIKICSVVSNTVSVGHSACPNVDGRGFASTSAASHSSGALVSDYFVAYEFKAIREEVKAMQTAMGRALRYVTSATVPASSFDFTAQTPGGSLIIGSNTITLTPVPDGVNGTDTDHPLWISSGTGTAEACTITGGTAVSGGTTGTVIVTCANTHSSTWTIGSATAGGKEAEVSLAGAGATITFGSKALHAPLVITTSSVTLAGVSPDGSTLTGDLAVSPVIQFGTSASTCNHCGLRDLTVTRAAGSIPAGSTTVSWFKFQYGYQFNARIRRSEIAELFTYKDTSSASLGFQSYGSYLDSASVAYIKVQNAVGIHFYGGEWGVNGAESPNPATAALILAGNSANDIRVVGTNIIPRTTGTKTASAVSLVGYTDAVGFVTFDSVHFENFLTSYFASDASTPVLQDLHVTHCTFSDSIATFALNAATQLKSSTFTATTTPASITLADPLWLTISGNFLAGAIAISGGAAANTVVTGNTIAASTAFTGAWTELNVSGNVFYGGTFPDFSGATGSISYGPNACDPSVANKCRLQTQGAILNQGSDTITSSPPAITNTLNGWKDVYSTNLAFGLAPYTAYFRYPSGFYGWGTANPAGDGSGTCDTAATVCLDLANGLMKLKGFTSRATENFISSQAGSNNAITATLTDISGVAIPLTNGLRITVRLSANSLQAGANTINLNGLGAKNIKSARNPANNIGTAYVVGATVILLYDVTSDAFVDVSQ